MRDIAGEVLVAGKDIRQTHCVTLPGRYINSAPTPKPAASRPVHAGMKHFFLGLCLLALAACSSERESAGRKVTEVVPRAVRGEVSTTETVGETGRNPGYVRRLHPEP